MKKWHSIQGEWLLRDVFIGRKITENGKKKCPMPQAISNLKSVMPIP